MVAAGLVAKKAVEKGLTVPPWVKTSLAPGSKVVRDYLEKAGLLPYLEKIKFHIVGYGCTTCIGNSGPLPKEVSEAIDEKDLVVASVLSGNRNFEGRINSEVRANYLMSPPLVVAFALAGRIDLDLRKDPIGKGKRWQAGLSGRPVAAAARSGRDDSEIHFLRHVHQELRRGLSRRRSLARVARAQGRNLRLGKGFHLHSPRPVLRRHDARTRAGSRHQPRARAGRARRQRHHRPHFSRRFDQERQPGRKIPDRAWREAG